MLYTTIAASATLTPIKSTHYDCTAGTNGIRLQLSPSTASMAGQELEFKKLDDTNSAVTLIPYGSETIDGKSFIFLIEQNQKMRLMNTGTGWVITSGTLIADTGFIACSVWAARKLGTTEIHYTGKVGTFLIGEIIKGNMWEAPGIIVKDTGTILVLWKFIYESEISEIMTGQLSGAHATVSANTKNVNTAFYHGFGVPSHLLDASIQSTTGATEATIFQLGCWEWANSETVSACVMNGVDINNVNFVTGMTYAPKVANNGTDASLTTENIYYRARVSLII